MKLYFLMAVLAALAVAVPWATQNLYLTAGQCEVQVWLWLAWGAGIGWIAVAALKSSTVGAPEAPAYLFAIGALSSCAAFQLPPTLGAVPALGALFWATGGVFATARSAIVAENARTSWRTGSAWSLAADR